MPKVSKIKPPGTRPEASRYVEDERTVFVCSQCGKKYTRQKSNFPASQSPLFRGNNGYLTNCNHCVEELYSHYKEALGSDEEAIHRVCLKFDIYWSPEIYAMLNKTYTTSSRIRAYISKTNLYKYVGKTYDDTLDEKYATMDGVLTRSEAAVPAEGADDTDGEGAVRETPVVTQDMIDFWGGGFTDGFYVELERRYARWTRDVPQPIDSAAQALYRNICILEATIAKNAAAGKPIEQSTNSLNNLIGSLNLKPVQKKQDEALDASFESMTFGQGIKMCELTRPIPKPKPEYEDVDGIVRYISIWFLGHLCKMLHIRNTYCKMYEDEMERLKVQRPELEDEDDEGAFNDIFGTPESSDDGGGT